jgi:hypothetical protein
MVLQRVFGNHFYPPWRYNGENCRLNTVCYIPAGEIDLQSDRFFRKNSSMDEKTEALPEDYHWIWRVLKCHHPRFFENFLIAALFPVDDELSYLFQFVDTSPGRYGGLLFEQFPDRNYSSMSGHASNFGRYKKRCRIVYTEFLLIKPSPQLPFLP